MLRGRARVPPAGAPTSGCWARPVQRPSTATKKASTTLRRPGPTEWCLVGPSLAAIRVVRIEGVRGSNPLSSTAKPQMRGPLPRSGSGPLDRLSAVEHHVAEVLVASPPSGRHAAWLRFDELRRTRLAELVDAAMMGGA